jgi:hypothetical protein
MGARLGTIGRGQTLSKEEPESGKQEERSPCIAELEM